MSSQKDNIDFLKDLIRQKELHIGMVENQLQKMRQERDQLILVVTELQKIDETGL